MDPRNGPIVNRQWVVVLQDGAYVIDWGDEVFQDMISGEFVEVREEEISHHILNRELDWLVKIGRVVQYNNEAIQCRILPERPFNTID